MAIQILFPVWCKVLGSGAMPRTTRCSLGNSPPPFLGLRLLGTSPVSLKR